MLVRYFRRPSRIEQLRSCSGGHLLEGFAEELSQGRYQWVAARKHIRAAEHFLHWIAHRNLSITSVEERYAQQFLDHVKRCCCRRHHPPLKPHRQKYSVDLWFDYLRRVGIVPTPTFVEPAVEAAMLTAKIPAAVIVPPSTGVIDQVRKPPLGDVGAKTAVNMVAEPAATVADRGLTESVLPGGGGGAGVTAEPPPPHPYRPSAISGSATVIRLRQLIGLSIAPFMAGMDKER